MTLPGSGTSSPLKRLVRIALYLYVVLVACPIRYWPLGFDLDSTWGFALNYANAHGLAPGRDVVFNYGPLGYLLFPRNMGNNLSQGILFQTALWLVLAAILADVFFRAGLALRNLALFSICFCLAAPIFWFNYAGAENLMLAGALLLTLMFYLRGSWIRYAVALVLVGLLPLFKLSAGMVGFAALAGFVVAQTIERRWKALRLAVLTVTVPAAVALTVCLAIMPSMQAFRQYLRGSAEIADGYSAAMSAQGSPLDFLAAAAMAILLLLMLRLQAATSIPMARFHGLLLAIPLFVSFKHGFVRQDSHVINFFCFVALALGLVSLTVHLKKNAIPYIVLFAILPSMVWRDYLGRTELLPGAAESFGLRQALMLYGLRSFGEQRMSLDASAGNYPEQWRLEPELVSLIGHAPVASLSANYTNLAAANLQIVLYPIIQRYQANTAYLDEVNAAWVKDKGPAFLIFDGRTIDYRDPWAESPATWLEVYRWYDTRLVGLRNLLLGRRSVPRFESMEPLSRMPIAFPGELKLPVSRDPVFWTLKCGFSAEGRLRKLLFRIPEVMVSVHSTDGADRTARILPAVLVSPVLGNLPGSLAQFAAIFQTSGESTYLVDRLGFAGDGASSYSESCEVELLRMKALRP